MNDSDFTETTTARKEIYKGRVIDVVVDEVMLPDGGSATRELVFHPGAVAVIPVTAEGKLVLVKQYRKALEKVILEIPAGKIDPGETSTLATGKRELEEETGYQASYFEYVTSFYVSPGFANEIVHIYEARDLTKAQHPLAQDEDEVIELFELTLSEAQEKIRTGEICDAKTVYAVQYLELKQLKEELAE